MQTLYLVDVCITPEYDGHDWSTYYGEEPTIYTTRAEAEAQAAALEQSGDWGAYPPPCYIVTKCEVWELEGFRRREAEKRWPCLVNGHAWHTGGTRSDGRPDTYCQWCGTTKAA